MLSGVMGNPKRRIGEVPMVGHAGVVFYSVRPLIPRRLQIALRRMMIMRKRSACGDVWPIDETACALPQGWPGWPDGKKFALILTHDVETEKGCEKCHTVATMENDSGFRASFNFVPEAYKIKESLRQNLIRDGFEVGVHGLTHDGNLYASRNKFARSAGKINTYLKEWQSVGFRTPCMYHNLDWIGELDIEYDSSTFDTDPFEPQPDGMGTIFPFWVRNGSPSKGYIELPYTLPQDFTLFVLMKERTIDIWKKKLDWIVQNGGMALLITHPDYMNGNKGTCGLEEYPAEFYEEFLGYVKKNYEGHYWNPLPKEVARFWKEKMVLSRTGWVR